MANSANPEINKKIATSALGTLVIATVFFYLGDRYAETLVTYPGQIFDHLSDAFLSMWQTIKDAPFALDMTSNSLLFGGACFLIIWMIWLRYVAFIGNYRSGEESGSARWGTLKEGKKFKDLQTEDNNLLFTKNFGLALHRPKFDPEYDRNLNVLVVGGSGSGKTFNYVTPNICQLNTSYFVTDPKGTLLKDAGYLFTDNGYKLKSFNTINLDESMHYNPLKYVKTDTDILSFVNCFIMNTNPEGKSSGDPFWENAEKMLYTALIALLRDWFPSKDYNMSSLLTLLSLAEARENDENFKSALDLMFLQIEEGKKYKQNDGSSPDTAGNAGLSRSFGTKQADNGWSWVPSKFKRNSDGVKPADCGGLSADEDFALMNYKNFKVAAGKTLKSILISCNVRLAPIATDGVRELLTYDEMEIDTLGDPDAKVAIFGILSDTDKTLSFLFAMSACAYAVNRCGYNTPLLMMTMQACADMNAQQLMAVFDATAAEFSDTTMAKVSTILMHTPALTSQQMRYLLAEARDGTPFPALESMKEHLLAQAEPEKAQVAETGVKSESRDMASGKEALAEQAGLDGTQKINQNKEME